MLFLVLELNETALLTDIYYKNIAVYYANKRQ